MKFVFPAKFLSLLLALLLLAPIGFAQSANTKEPVNQNNITTENDRLPFMQTEQTAETQEPGTGSLLLKTLGAMLLVVGLIFAGAWSLKKFGFGNIKPNASQDVPDLTILSSVSLGSGRTISTVKFGERVLLVGSTAQSFTLLADEIGEEPSAEKDVRTSPRSVADLLSEESLSFEKELETAQNKFNFLGDNGGRV